MPTDGLMFLAVAVGAGGEAPMDLGRGGGPCRWPGSCLFSRLGSWSHWVPLALLPWIRGTSAPVVVNRSCRRSRGLHFWQRFVRHVGGSLLPVGLPFPWSNKLRTSRDARLAEVHPPEIELVATAANRGRVGCERGRTRPSCWPEKLRPQLASISPKTPAKTQCHVA